MHEQRRDIKFFQIPHADKACTVKRLLPGSIQQSGTAPLRREVRGGAADVRKRADALQAQTPSLEALTGSDIRVVAMAVGYSDVAIIAA